MYSCPKPILMERDGAYYTFPCGKCPLCYSRKVSAWSFRLMEEEKISSSAFFITLTYSDENLKRTKNNFKNLVKEDLRLYIKRLRRESEQPIKFYACGEYGGRFKRPHYHLIMFNAKESEIIKAWSRYGKPLGHVHVGKVSEASIGYTLKYMSKPSKIPMFERDDRQKEFAIMSKGLGKNYLTQNMVTWHKNDLLERMHCNLKDGKKIAMPRYYKDKIYTRDERAELKNHHYWKTIERIEEDINSPDAEKNSWARKQVEKHLELKQELQNNKRLN